MPSSAIECGQLGDAIHQVSSRCESNSGRGEFDTASMRNYPTHDVERMSPS